MEVNFIITDSTGRTFSFSKECSLHSSAETRRDKYHVWRQNKLIAVFIDPCLVVVEPDLFIDSVMEF